MKYFLTFVAVLLLGVVAHAQIAPPTSPPLNGLPGQAAGPLDSAGRVPSAQTPVSAFEYKGIWDAATNTPTLADGVGTVGDVYLISPGGTQDLGGGSVNYLDGNLLVYDGTVWGQGGGGNIPTPATPTGSVGLSAIPGVATSYMRSDAAPALNQTITPTWSGAHTFSRVATQSVPSLKADSSNPQFELSNSSAATDSKRWNLAAGSDQLILRSLNDAGDGFSQIWRATRAATAITQQEYLTGGAVRLTITDSDVAAGASYTPVNPKSLATKEYVDAAGGGGGNGALVWAGRCSFEGAPLSMPAGWTCSRQGTTGGYRITPPGSVNAREATIVVSITGNWVGMIQGYGQESYYFYVSIKNPSGQPMDASFSFVVVQYP